MRSAFLALILCAGVVATCQSLAPAPKTDQRVIEDSQGIQSRANCKNAMPDISVLGFAPLKEEPRFTAPAIWHMNSAQAASKFPFPLSPSNLRVQPYTLLAQNEGPNSYQMPFRQWPNAKVEPIPTRWPNAKFEPIPTEWPSLRTVPVTSQSRTQKPIQAPLK